jgi:hypothetical protein
MNTNEYDVRYGCCGWQEFIAGIEDVCEVGETIGRKQILNITQLLRPWTMDTYRTYLTAAGYLMRVKRGMYKRIKPFPSSFTMRQCRREAYVF